MSEVAPHEETFWDLLQDPAHWQFELVVNALENFITVVVIGWFIMPHIRKWLKLHKKEEARLAQLEQRMSALENQ